ncbi:MAG TPA: sugar-binding protein, partial [Candidatus Brocadiia bacterium]|nr:sugar-binding protein [Candidatus Brocadiia bacterium]
MRPLHALALAAALALPALPAEDLSKPRRITCPLITQAPTIDGDLSDPCWSQASVGANFLLRKRLAETAKAQTTFLIGRDAKFIYFAAVCEGQDPAKLFADATTPDARRAYKDDVIEILFDPKHTKDDSYHLIINSKGVIWDAEEHRLPMTPRMDVFEQRWNSGARAAGGRQGQNWTLEVAIPLAAFGPDIPLQPGAEWGFQVGREKWGPARAETEPDTELSVWSRGYGAFNEPSDFGVLIIGGQKTVCERVASWKEPPSAAAMPDTTKGVRRTYNFTRAFAFGP